MRKPRFGGAFFWRTTYRITIAAPERGNHNLAQRPGRHGHQMQYPGRFLRVDVYRVFGVVFVACLLVQGTVWLNHWPARHRRMERTPAPQGIGVAHFRGHEIDQYPATTILVPAGALAAAGLGEDHGAAAHDGFPDLARRGADGSDSPSSFVPRRCGGSSSAGFWSFSPCTRCPRRPPALLAPLSALFALLVLQARERNDYSLMALARVAVCGGAMLATRFETCGRFRGRRDAVPREQAIRGPVRAALAHVPRVSLLQSVFSPLASRAAFQFRAAGAVSRGVFRDGEPARLRHRRLECRHRFVRVCVVPAALAAAVGYPAGFRALSRGGKPRHHRPLADFQASPGLALLSRFPRVGAACFRSWCWTGYAPCRKRASCGPWLREKGPGPCWRPATWPTSSGFSTSVPCSPMAAA